MPNVYLARKRSSVVATSVLERPHSSNEQDVPTRFRRFRPSLALGHQEEIRTLGARLAVAPFDQGADIVHVMIAQAEERLAVLADSGLSRLDAVPTLRYVATLKILRDLLIQGWSVRLDDEGIMLDAPGYKGSRFDDPEPRKEALRKSFAFARDAQLSEPSTRGFIAAMERRGISRVFASGDELANRLIADGELGIQPELELIEPGARDPTTGLLLQEIWRYARHFWSIPYQSTPGRNMFYLVRDCAVDARPVMGIAALGNPILGLNQRDHFFGWSISSLDKRLRTLDPGQQQSLAGHFLKVLRAGLDETYHDDLLPNGLPDDWREAVVELERIEQQSAARRLSNLANHDNDRDSEYRLIRDAQTAMGKGSPDVDWSSLSKTSLYVRKRAGILADLLKAYGILTELGFSDAGGSIAAAISTEDGVRAIEIALRRIKQGAIASNVMELITCGALPPYNDVLGGKLVAMLMLSSEVVEQFALRYSGRISLIASALAGRPVVRPAQLAAITTSSLYAIGSSQYSRIKVSHDKNSVSYRRIGTTESFGTVHFAPETVGDLTNISRLVDNLRQVNNLFGEGTSPKLRQVRAGLEILGLQPDTFLRHHSPRLLYAAPLAKNISDVSLGIADSPEYILPSGKAATRLIIDHWQQRWLKSRASRPDILERLRPQLFDTFRLANDVAAIDAASVGRVSPLAHQSAPVSIVGAKSTFIERLYRSSNSYADRLTPEELDAVHVDLGVDRHLVEQADASKQIVITGNPGDGKTHLIERMRPELERAGAVVITDANALSNDDILRSWSECETDGRPFVLAINEWPLFVLQRSARQMGFAPVAEALRQVQAARFYVDAQRPAPPQGRVMVIDLSLRNLLARSVVKAVISRLTEDRFYEGINPADPLLANRRALSNSQVQERLGRILDLASARLGHVTMRQLMGFVAYLLTGGQTEAERIRAGQDESSFTYSTLAFHGGVGRLFDSVRAVFDPATITHPLWDEALWLGETAATEWLDKPPANPLAMPDLDRESGYAAIKRRFYFEHANGTDLLALIPRDEIEFQNVLTSESRAAASIVRDFVLDINRFYEPDCSDSERDRLQLWQSHRYDVRPPQAFIALRSLPHQQLRIERPRMAEWVKAWLPPEQEDLRSFALVAAAADNHDIALMEVDRDLYLTLIEAQRGLGSASWSRSSTRRITRFVDQIYRAVEFNSGVEDLRIRNVETNLDERFSIQREPARYQL